MWTSCSWRMLYRMKTTALTTELIKLPADELLKKFGGGSHKPGSGSAAALIALVACKLLQTVVTLTRGREQYRGVQDQLTLANQDVIRDIEPFLYRAVQEDSQHFAEVIQLRQARDAESDPKKRKALAEKALAALRTATDIPIEIAEKALILAEKALVIYDLGFQSARGDSGVSISAALSAASGAISIIYLNLTSFKGGVWAIETRRKADELLERSQRLGTEFAHRMTSLQKEIVTRESKSDDETLSRPTLTPAADTTLDSPPISEDGKHSALSHSAGANAG